MTEAHLTTRAGVSIAHPASARAAPAPEYRDIDVPIPRGFRADAGDRLPDATVRLRRFGRSDGAPVLVMGGISSGRDLAGPRGWWRDQVGEGAAVDLHGYAAYALDFAPTGDVRVRVSPRTQARLVELALDQLGIEALDAIIGASYGGMVGLALAALAPQRVRRLCIISAAHRPSALAHAWRGVQRRIAEFGIERGRPEEGLSLARQLAMITYRSGAEFSQRFHGLMDQDGLCDLDRYLIARGQAYGELMPVARWLSLSEAIDRFSVHPGAIAAPTTLVACGSDQLVPFSDVSELAQQLPNLKALHALESIYGHDAFLKESEALSPIIRTFLEEKP